MVKWLAPLLALAIVSCQSASPPSPGPADHPGLGPLVERVSVSRDALQAAAAQFQATRAQLSELAASDGADMQAAVAATRINYDNSVSAAVAARTANAAVVEAADSLFQEWRIEVDVYTDARLKADSQAKLAAVWQDYQDLLQALRDAETGMDPMLAALNQAVASANDHAEAGAALATQLSALQSSIDGVMRSIENAIAVCDVFNSSIR